MVLDTLGPLVSSSVLFLTRRSCGTGPRVLRGVIPYLRVTKETKKGVGNGREMLRKGIVGSVFTEIGGDRVGISEGWTLKNPGSRTKKYQVL